MTGKETSMRKATSILLFAVALAIGSRGALVAQPQQGETRGNAAVHSQDKASLWMKHKLAASQRILEGMTRADYEMIEKSAEGMQIASYLEAWIRADLPDYKAQFQAFDYANRAIVSAARHKNLDGVTIAYTQLTISCVQCHKIVRDKVKE
jgi:cytochrome c556